MTSLVTSPQGRSSLETARPGHYLRNATKEGDWDAVVSVLRAVPECVNYGAPVSNTALYFAAARVLDNIVEHLLQKRSGCRRTKQEGVYIADFRGVREEVFRCDVTEGRSGPQRKVQWRLFSPVLRCGGPRRKWLCPSAGYHGGICQQRADRWLESTPHCCALGPVRRWYDVVRIWSRPQLKGR